MEQWMDGRHARLRAAVSYFLTKKGNARRLTAACRLKDGRILRTNVFTTSSFNHV